MAKQISIWLEGKALQFLFQLFHFEGTIVYYTRASCTRELLWQLQQWDFKGLCLKALTVSFSFNSFFFSCFHFEGTIIMDAIMYYTRASWQLQCIAIDFRGSVGARAMGRANWPVQTKG